MFYVFPVLMGATAVQELTINGFAFCVTDMIEKNALEGLEGYFKFLGKLLSFVYKNFFSS